MSQQLLLTHLRVHQVRNLVSVDVALLSGVTVFVGDNGQGKTNLLESIALGSYLKPIRPIRHLKDLVQIGCEEAALSVQVGGRDNFDVRMALTPLGKRVWVGGKPIRDAATLAERLSVVTFVPDDLNMVIGGASYRRKALDQLCYGLFPAYLTHLRAYEKALLHRNQLLKQPAIDHALLNSFTQMLVQSGAQVLKLRLDALEIIQPHFEQALLSISNQTLQGSMQYEASHIDMQKQTVEESLNQAFVSCYAEERARKTTVIGPHLDDLSLQLNGHLARYTASRGQSRALVLAFKIAQLNSICAHRLISPILLLDDVVSELDPHNAQALLNTVESLQVQTFITTTHLSALPFQQEHLHVMYVKEGRLLQYA